MPASRPFVPFPVIKHELHWQFYQGNLANEIKVSVSENG